MFLMSTIKPPLVSSVSHQLDFRKAINIIQTQWVQHDLAVKLKSLHDNLSTEKYLSNMPAQVSCLTQRYTIQTRLSREVHIFYRGLISTSCFKVQTFMAQTMPFPAMPEMLSLLLVYSSELRHFYHLPVLWKPYVGWHCCTQFACL